MRTKLVDMTGQTFGRLTVIERAPRNDKNGVVLWVCRCICGQENMVRRSNLLSGHSNSCGCLRREVMIVLAREKHKRKRETKEQESCPKAMHSI